MTTAVQSRWSSDLERWNHGLLHGGLVSRAAAADALAKLADAPPHWTFTVCDKWWTPAGDLDADLMGASGVDPRNEKPSAEFKLKGSSTLLDHMRSCRTSMVGIEAQIGAQRHNFYVDTNSYAMEQNSGPSYTSTARCFGIWDVLNYLIIVPTWFLPLQAQPISHAVLAGPLVFVLENVIAECFSRIQNILLEFVNNALSLNPDLRAWVGTLLQNSDATQLLKTPAYVVRTNPILPGGPIVVRTVRMVTVGAFIKDACAPYGVTVDVELWRLGDPQPDPWANLTQTTYVVRVKDRTPTKGPTNTVADSVIGTVVDLGGSLGELFAPVIQQAEGMNGVYVAPALGVDFLPPLAMFVAPEPGQKGSAITALEVVDHTPKAWNLLLGGKSPAWLNALQNAWWSWIIDNITILIGITGIPSTLLDGFLNDAFFAFAVIELYDRRDDMGPMHPCMEQFQATQASPYNVDGAMAFIDMIWNTKGYTSAQIIVQGGEYEYGRDIVRGGAASVVYGNRRWMLSDYVEAIMWRYSPTERQPLMLQIGDGRAEAPPLAKHAANITGTQEAINTLMLAPQG